MTQQSSAGNYAAQRDIYTVSRLNQEARGLLEQTFPLIWIEGELSNVSRPSSGHLYFSLKDEKAQVRCAMFRNRNIHLRFKPEEGKQVLLRARISLYEGRGEFQIIAEHMEEAGDGALRRAFEQLKQRLATEGIFDSAHKKPFPELPGRIGIITSPTGAAIQDILTVLKRRFPAIPIIIYPTSVQGEAAAEEISCAIELANQRLECDALILARGGGSIEDLWCFNDERVAYAIHESSLPIICGVGHEMDITIADLVADQRAPTPSAAAELLSPDRDEWLQTISLLGKRLERKIQTVLPQLSQKLAWLHKGLQQHHPGVSLQQQNQRLDGLEQRLHRTSQYYFRNQWAILSQQHSRLQQHTPAHQLKHLNIQCRNLFIRLQQTIKQQLETCGQHLSVPARALDAVSPLATLERGYSIASRKKDNKILRDAGDVKIGEKIETQLARGSLVCNVEKINKK
jgi:exodeoxyribonuclease VII large subunit